MDINTSTVREIEARRVGVGDTIVGRFHSFEVVAVDTSDGPSPVRPRGVTQITMVADYGASRTEFYPADARVAVVA